MYLINKDETEYTGQVGCSIITRISSFPCTPPVHLVDHWIPKLAVLITKLYSNLFQLDRTCIQADLQKSDWSWQAHYDNCQPDPWLYLPISLRKHPMWMIQVDAIKCLRPCLYFVKTFLHFIRATPFPSPASAACKNSSKYTFIFWKCLLEFLQFHFYFLLKIIIAAWKTKCTLFRSF